MRDAGPHPVDDGLFCYAPIVVCIMNYPCQNFTFNSVRLPETDPRRTAVKRARCFNRTPMFESSPNRTAVQNVVILSKSQHVRLVSGSLPVSMAHQNLSNKTVPDRTTVRIKMVPSGLQILRQVLAGSFLRASSSNRNLTGKSGGAGLFLKASWFQQNLNMGTVSISCKRFFIPAGVMRDVGPHPAGGGFFCHASLVVCITHFCARFSLGSFNSLRLTAARGAKCSI